MHIESQQSHCCLCWQDGADEEATDTAAAREVSPFHASSVPITSQQSSTSPHMAPVLANFLSKRSEAINMIIDSISLLNQSGGVAEWSRVRHRLRNESGDGEYSGSDDDADDVASDHFDVEDDDEIGDGRRAAPRSHITSYEGRCVFTREPIVVCIHDTIDSARVDFDEMLRLSGRTPRFSLCARLHSHRHTCQASSSCRQGKGPRGAPRVSARDHGRRQHRIRHGGNLHAYT